MIPKSLTYDQLPKTNLQQINIGDYISLVTYNRLVDMYLDAEYVYRRERLGKVISVNEDGSFKAHMESVSGNVSNDYDFTIEQLNNPIFADGKMAHVLYKL